MKTTPTQAETGQWLATQVFLGRPLHAIGGTRADANRALMRLMSALVICKPTPSYSQIIPKEHDVCQ